MLDEYRALSVALRRPMGRWWRRVGWWWLLGLIVLMLAEGALRGYIVPWLEAGSQAGSAGSGGIYIMRLLNVAPWGWLWVADVMQCLGRVLVFYACLMAGAHVTRLALDLQRGFPYPTLATPRRLRFLQSVAAGWPFMVLWLAIGSSALAVLVCAITGRHDTLFGSVSLYNEDFFPTSSGEPWAALVTIVLLIALANADAGARTASWLWATALGCAPLLKTAGDALYQLFVSNFFVKNLEFARLPENVPELGWLLGGSCFMALFVLYRRQQHFWAGLLLAAMLVSAVLSGYREEVPLVRYQLLKQGQDQIDVSSPAGQALVFIRSLSDFPRSAMVSFQAFEQSQLTWGGNAAESQGEAAGALMFYAPISQSFLAPAWARFFVAPLNLLYVLLLVYAITAFLLGEAKPRPSPPAMAKPLPRE